MDTRMAGSAITQHSIRKALGALKDSTTVGLAKVNSDYKELDVAVVRATNHVEELAKEKHIGAIFYAVSASRPRADVAYCINALARRLAKTHNWAVAIKILIVIHRALGEVPSFLQVILNYNRSKGHMLNLSHFKDDSSPNAWEYSAWVRTYALYLEERLECFRILKYDVETECSRSRELDSSELLEHLPALQLLLFRLLSCKPEGAAMYNNVILYALSIVASESIKIYNAINGATLNLADKFFEMKRHDALRGLAMYRKAEQQAEKLSEFHQFCQGLVLVRGKSFIKIEQPPLSFLSKMEEYVKEATCPSPVQQNEADSDKKTAAHKAILPTDQKKVNEDDEKPLEHPVPQNVEAPLQSPNYDLLGLDDFSQGFTKQEEKDTLALAFGSPSDDTNTTLDLINGTAGWELAGGLDNLALDNLYHAARDRTTTESYHMQQIAQNPFEDDPFFDSKSLGPPAGMQIAVVARQHMPCGNNDTSTFYNPFAVVGEPYYLS